jgi:hypothetical protein
MNQQLGLAMGLYAGPIRLSGEFGVGNNPALTGDYASAGKAAISFLDKVSTEEKNFCGVGCEPGLCPTSV